MTRGVLPRLAVVLAAVALLAWRFLAIDAGSASASDTLRPWAIETILVCAIAVFVIRGLSWLERRADRGE